MKVVCPRCNAGYVVLQDDVDKASGLATCSQCNTPFDVVAGRELLPGSFDHTKLLRLESTDFSDAPPVEPEEVVPPPFDVPDDLPPLEVEHDVDLEISTQARPTRRVLRILATISAMLLAAGLLVQLGWGYRDYLLAQYPALEPVCEFIPCRAEVGRDTTALRVLQRNITRTENAPESLTLRIRFTNAATFAQPYPDIQLSLLDNGGNPVVRRRLDPGEYMIPTPSQDSRIAPGEVVTISVDFVDPGYLATGFVIDFL